MKIRHYIFLLVLVALTSCDTFHGISRSAEIKTMPATADVSRAIASVVGIDNVTCKDDEGSAGSRTFYYSGTNNISGRVLLSVDEAGRTFCRLSFVRSNVIPPQDVIDANYDIMRRIETALETQCGLEGLIKSMTEHASSRMKHK